MITSIWIVAFIILFTTLAYHRASLSIWSISGFVYLSLLTALTSASWLTLVILWLIFVVPAIVFNCLPLRRRLLTHRILTTFQKKMPSISKTEKEAIAAGTVQWAGELFCGAPDWQKMLDKPVPTLSSEEQAFLDGPVEKLCSMIDDWDITHNRCDLPPEMWQFIKDNGFFGMMIPQEFGGKGFSELMHSAVIMKLSSCSITVASTVAVPNSLGPAELILKYGTKEQKDYYLPRLATGEEIPCFALTGPEAGSDASSMPDRGIVCKEKFQGEEVLGIRLTFNKRYITLAPIATVIALAFKLYDPEGLLGQEKNIGITCALVPSNLEGISIGRRHFPLNCAFLNGPIQGDDLFIPVDNIIGGQPMAGQGWRMLVECLSSGRGITLPSISAGGAKACSLLSGAYTRIRQQFGMPIGYFEGIEEALARIAGYTYLIDAMRHMTVAAINRGEKPAILTAIAKYHTTTMGRSMIIDAMDIHGGKGICLGPNNYLGRAYQSSPIGITVEGANILTRSMIIFGQGSMRCHPYLLDELNAAQNEDKKQGLAQFDKAIFAHVGFLMSNFVRTLLLGITNGRLVLAPRGVGKRYFQQLTRYSSAFAFLADLALITLGGKLKRMESLSARLGDILSMLAMSAAALKYFHDNKELSEHETLLHWATQETHYNIQQRFDEILKNFPNRWLAAFMRFCIFPFGRRLRKPSDKLNHQLARFLLNPSDARDHLTKGIYSAAQNASMVGKLETVLQQVIAIEPIEARVQKAKSDKLIEGYDYKELVANAIKMEVISEEEAEQLLTVHKARLAVIAVDDFANSELAR